MEPRTFAQRNIWSKLGNFKSKSSPNLELIKVNFGQFFEKNCAQRQKISPKWRKIRPIWSPWPIL
jgi:hypothetical protein